MKKKNYILMMLLSFSFLAYSSPLESSPWRKSYILTTDGEKIKIAHEEDIVYSKSKVIYHTKVVPEGEKELVSDIGYVQNYRYETKSIEADRIVKIVDGDRLYLPFKYGKETRIFRLIAKNKNYILGFYSMEHIVEDNIFHLRQAYVILDHDYNIVKEGEVYGMKMKESKKGINEIKKYFGNCLDRNKNLYDVVKKKEFVTNKNYSFQKYDLIRLIKNIVYFMNQSFFTIKIR